MALEDLPYDGSYGSHWEARLMGPEVRRTLACTRWVKPHPYAHAYAYYLRASSVRFRAVYHVVHAPPAFPCIPLVRS